MYVRLMTAAHQLRTTAGCFDRDVLTTTGKTRRNIDITAERHPHRLLWNRPVNPGAKRPRPAPGSTASR